MEKLQSDMDRLNYEIQDLEDQIRNAEEEAEANIQPLNDELAQVMEDKRRFASKGDFESVQSCIARESNLKFRISAQWNECSILKDKLNRLKKKRQDLEYQINLKKDQIKRNNEILAQMDKVLENYAKTQNLKQAAIDSGIDPNHVEQWHEWGKKNFNETYAYFYTRICEIDNDLKRQETERLKSTMDSVVEAYRKTNSLKEASEIAGVSYDTVMYLYEWGSRGFGSENTYFFRKLDL
ncbi:hypothetical protein [Methanobrevibacter sp.]|uniref:hypothetical protein n=1 Tax=Methanobrevibacter sp. TaxID=66852 RepID=UPI0026DFA2FD|nr:hypothetical protein [Methanobrevibacter sp.]MDO5859876.1 hypothetical protein [Methanobrevibacter sp.]